jgi:hypothetical protein
MRGRRRQRDRARVIIEGNGGQNYFQECREQDSNNGNDEKTTKSGSKRGYGRDASPKKESQYGAPGTSRSTGRLDTTLPCFLY